MVRFKKDMKKEQIISRETNNNLKTIYAYYNHMSYTWIAYGYSAYLLNVSLKENMKDSFRGYSSEYELPYVVVDDKILRKIFTDVSDKVTIFENEVTLDVTNVFNILISFKS